jgi:hypothetical protein
LIDTLPQYAGGLKNHNSSGPQNEILFGLGVAAAARILAADTKLAKAADEDIFFPGKGVFDNIQDAFHGAASFLLTEPELEIDVSDNLFFGQGHGWNSFLLPEGGVEPAK